MFRWFTSRKFVFQLITIFIIFTLGAVIGLGIPVMLILNRQVEAQMQALFDQADQMTVALYENKVNRLTALIDLIRERPTLNRLVIEGGDPGALDQYLDEFIDNANADMIAVCWQNTPIGLAGKDAVPSLCETERFGVFVTVDQAVWLLVNGRFDAASADDYHIVVGQRADSILGEFKDQSGLDYALYDHRQLMAVSEFKLDAPLRRIMPMEIHPDQKLPLASENPHLNTHLARLIPLGDQTEFSLIGLLDISPYHAISRNVRNIILVMLLTVSLVGVISAILVSRQISKPMNTLARSAVALREGDLKTPLSGQSKVWEINQLTNALEDARVSLNYSLDQLQREKDWMENLLNAVVEGLVAIDMHQNVTFASEAIERILGVAQADILGRSIDEVFVTTDGETPFSQQLSTMNLNRKIQIMVNGREILLAVSATRIVPPDAGDATLALVIRDVTDEERIHRLIGEFLANITHEFRTPLTALSASVELLLDQLPSLSLTEFEQLLHAINFGIIDLQSLIDNLIEAASIEAGRFKVNPQPIALETIIADAISMVNPIAQREKLHLVHHVPQLEVFVQADRRRTCQALVNLLSNAIKHSPEGGTIVVSSEIKGDVVQVEVQDEGKGVQTSQRSKLFYRFSSPDSKSNDGQIGLGLGLSVVKAIIEAQGGYVGFRDAEEGGAVFWFTLPLLKDGA